MVLFLILLGCIIFILLIFLIICASTIRINIQNLEITTLKKEDIIKNYLFFIQIYFLDKIKIFQLKINKNRIERIKNAKIIKKLSKIQLKKLKEKWKNKLINKEKIKKLSLLIAKEIKPKIGLLKLEIELGTQEAIVTSFISSGIGIALSLILSKIAINEKKVHYKVMPVYQNKNFINLRLNCIIHVKMVHIMNIIYIFLKQGSVKNNERTSNRRFNDYSHEQYTRYGRRKYHYRGTN